MLEGNNYSKAQIKAGEPQKQPTLWVMMMIIFFFFMWGEFLPLF